MSSELGKFDERLLTVSGLLEHVQRQYEKGSHTLCKKGLPRVSREDLINLAENQAELAKIDSRYFEELVAELLRADGYEDVNLIPQHNAPGPDIVAVCHNHSGGAQKFIVECKRWHNAVGIDVVRSMMYKIDLEYRASGGIIVTTSRFTRDAVEEVERFHRWRLTLVDGERVLHWILRHAADMGVKQVEHVDLKTTREGMEIIQILESGFRAPSLEVSKGGVCHSCGGIMICGYVDLGAVDFYDNYFHVCSECLRHGHVERYEMKGYEDLAECPFCSRIW